jgi:hypothetical protein
VAVNPRASDFSPDQPRAGWSRCVLPGGEFHAESEHLDDLERLGLLDPERWRKAELGGVMIERKPDRWVCCLPGHRKTFVCRYRRRKRHGQWLERLLQRRSRAHELPNRLAKLTHASGHVILTAELSGARRGEHETFQVSLEAATFEHLKAPQPDLASVELYPSPG